MTDRYELYADGGIQPVNPGGVATYGFVIYRNGEEYTRGHGFAAQGPRATNNVAEYAALVNGLRYLAMNEEARSAHVTVRMDSQLIIYQIWGKWKCKQPHLKVWLAEAKLVASQFTSLTYEWIPREQNHVADSLATRAYEEFLTKNSMTHHGTRTVGND